MIIVQKNSTKEGCNNHPSLHYCTASSNICQLGICHYPDSNWDFSICHCPYSLQASNLAIGRLSAVAVSPFWEISLSCVNLDPNNSALKYALGLFNSLLGVSSPSFSRWFLAFNLLGIFFISRNLPLWAKMDKYRMTACLVSTQLPFNHSCTRHLCHPAQAPDEKRKICTGHLCRSHESLI